MERNEYIRSMIETGEYQLKEQEEEQRNMHAKEIEKTRGLWEKRLDEARSYFNSDIRDAVQLFPNRNFDLDKPPESLEKDTFYLDIEGCAPILVKFIKNNDVLECRYIIPRIVDDPEQFYKEFAIAGEYGWAWTNRTLVGWMVPQATFTSLSTALATAVQAYKSVQELIADNAAQEPEQPEYQDLDGSEPLPDQVLINGVRQLIREEIQKLRA